MTLTVPAEGFLFKTSIYRCVKVAGAHSVLYLPVMLTGDRYVVMDCGGGTVDLTVHQIRLPEGHLKELYKASGNKLSEIIQFWN